MPLIPIRRALLSVSDKTGLLELARFLQQNNVEMLSTGGTANFLRTAGILVREVSDYTGFPEILDGRVKTLHPKIHGGLLAVREKPSHMHQLLQQGIGEIDLVVVNLYPFRETIARSGVSFEEAVEQIDIGGPSMLRSAAKNHAGVAVLSDPLDYSWVLEELRSRSCSLSAATCFLLAQKVFALTAAYDAAIATYLSGHVWSTHGPAPGEQEMPRLEILALEKVQNLRYGENPHQRGALYHGIASPRAGVAGAEVLQGKELSYNNLMDADAAWELAREFDLPSAAVIKHTNPCGVAQSDTLCDAYVQARDSDPVSAYGSVVALNREVDADTARALTATFVEVILAPEFTSEALNILAAKKNLRLLRMNSLPSAPLQFRQISGGFLAQDKDFYAVKPDELKCVTKRSPSEAELKALLFGWRVVKHVKSNAIVFSTASRTLGIGAGQMSRVDSVKWGSQRALLPLEGCAMASDAFFPFADGIVAAAGYGVRSVIQPGGSVRDEEVIAAADAHDMAMVFTGIRHFRH